MTTSIPIPDHIIETAEMFAVSNVLSRNELYETALKHYLKFQNTPKDTSLREQFDEIYKTESAMLDPIFSAVQIRTVDHSEHRAKFCVKSFELS